MNPSSSPGSQSIPSFASDIPMSGPRGPASSPGSAPVGIALPKPPSSSPGRSSYTPHPGWRTRLPLSVEQVVQLTLAVVMFATALIALQMVLVVFLLIHRFF